MTVKGQSTDHSKAANELKTVKTLKSYLCSLAYERTIHPEMCASCVSSCRYGERLLQLMKEETEAK